MSSASFSKLFEPGQIGQMQVRNRIMMAAMAGMTATAEGFVSERMIDYYEARAKGGVGLIIVGSCSVEFPLGISGKLRLAIDDDKFIPGLSRVVEAIHRHGAKAALQLQHAGPAAIESIIHMQPIAASAVGRPLDYAYRVYSGPREMTVEDIVHRVKLFAQAAERARKVGFDGVELLAAHRYLINSFLSPYYNRRQDNYGGGLENRARFLLEIIAAIRQAVGRDFPVWPRINGWEEDVDGITPEMATQLAQLLEKTGQVDAVHVSRWHNVPISPTGFAIEYAARVKKAVSIPVIAVGHISPQLGDKVLSENKADFIAMGRQLIADPELPNKAAAGKVDHIAPCQRCNNCIGTDECTVNASHLKEKANAIVPAKEARKVVVIGGGPGGLEAARVAAQRGHSVVLYEKMDRLGGQLVFAAIMREQPAELIKYLELQAIEHGVRIELGKTADVEQLTALKPDVIVVATGATSALPDIPGIDSGKVLSASDIQGMMNGRLKPVKAGGMVAWRRRLWRLGISIMKRSGPSTMRRLLHLSAPFGKKVVVMGMKLHGVEIAYFLAGLGKQVTVVDSRAEIADRIIAMTGEGGGELPMPVLRQHYLAELDRLKVPTMLGVKYEAITDRGLQITTKEGKRQTLEADTIVFAADYKPDDELARALKGKFSDVRLVGDCAEPVGIMEAIRAGNRVGREI